MRNLVRYSHQNPFSLLDQLENEFENMLNSNHFHKSWGHLKSADRSFVPNCDMNENDTHYLISLDLPGVPKENIDIQVSDNLLSITGERKWESKGSGFSEKHYGQFKRSFSLPKHVNEDAIEANYEDGVLYVALKKETAAESKAITINEEKKEGFWQKLLGSDKKSSKAIDVEKH